MTQDIQTTAGRSPIDGCGETKGCFRGPHPSCTPGTLGCMFASWVYVSTL